MSPIKLLNFEKKFQLSDYDVLVRTILCGYCGTDKSILTYNMSFRSSVFVDTDRHKQKNIFLGHEIVGEVIKIGKEVSNLSINDRVILDSKIRNKSKILSNQYAGWSSHFVRNEDQLVKISKELSAEKAVLLEPIACSYGGIKTANVKKNDNVLILGAGIIGQGILTLLRYFFKNEINITIATNSEVHNSIINKNLTNNIIFKENLFNASKRILKTEIKSNKSNKILKKGYDNIFDCTGDKKIFNDLLRISNHKASIVLMGANMNISKIDPTPLWHREIKIFGSHAYEKTYPDLKVNTLNYLENLILEKHIDIDNFHVNKVNINDWKNLFKESNTSIKNAVSF